MYKIIREENSKEIKWILNFEFKKSNAIVEATINKGDTDLRIVSLTDGFHWFEFFMAQQPNCEELDFQGENDYKQAQDRVSELFKENGFLFRPEDKESCFLNCKNNFKYKQIEIIAKLIDERFANRERFF